MKRLISGLIVVALVFTLASSAAFADYMVSDNEMIESFSYVDEYGQMISVLAEQNETETIVRVYCDKRLTQKSILDSNSNQIYEERYDLDKDIQSRSTFIESMEYEEYDITVSHKPVSEVILETIPDLVISPYALINEPVDNSGLSASGYGDGYYYLGTDGGYYYAPNVYGDLYRKYTQTFDGYSKYWEFDIGMSLATIVGIVLKSNGPASAIGKVLVFTIQQVLGYAQAAEAKTYRFDYKYRVRINGSIQFETNRNITYWKIYSPTTGKQSWDEKSFNGGFSMANTEMILAAIKNYTS